MALLSVNVNKVATLRNTREKNIPNVLQVSLDLIEYGAQGITVHPRPDQRHIRSQDVRDLSQNISVELNIEGRPTSDFLALVKETRPAQCTLVPDAPDALTSNAGWRALGNEHLLESSIDFLKKIDCRVSLFVDPFAITEEELSLFKKWGSDRIELYTESYSDAYSTEKRANITRIFKECALLADQVGLEINAGHDLNLENLSYFAQEIPQLKEVSIGHALICDALYLGLETTVKKYLDCLKI